MPLRSRGASRRRMLLEEAIIEDIRTGALQDHAYPRRMAQRGLSSGRMRRGGPGSTHARRSTWPDSRRHVGARRTRCTSLALSTPTPLPDVARGRSLLPAGPHLAEELGMRPLVAHCHHGLGRLYHQTGRAAHSAPPWLPPSTSTVPWT